MDKSQNRPDFLIIGSGIAGLFAALKLAQWGKVLVLAKGNAQVTGTALAQGGIASVTATSDSFEKHIADTLTAGAGLCHSDVVKMAVEQAPARIHDLGDYGIEFDKIKSNGEFDLTREGGHSEKRVLHIFDQTGLGIQKALLKACRENAQITILENKMAIDLILNTKVQPFNVGAPEVLGAYVLDMPTSHVEKYLARFTILATGGAGKVYLYTSNWEGATGDGIAMAKRAGARVANMEFLQFHPTCLYHPEARNFLITEALRGEGAKLILKTGEEFMHKYHKLGTLAPRDIVARAIDAEIKKSGQECVYLDVRHKKAAEIRERFPGIYEGCLKYGIDITKDPIPVVPAAHYLCGGVLTDSNGQTDIKRLFAIGENACTGLHGANRLASNSLMEGTVFANNCASAIKNQLDQTPWIDLPVKDWDPGNAIDPDEMVVVEHNWDEIRRLMWNYVGIVRSTKRLERAKNRITMLREEIKEYYYFYRVTRDLLELRNIALIAELIIDSALWRKESRGIHYTLDYPETNPLFQKDTII